MQMERGGQVWMAMGGISWLVQPWMRDAKSLEGKSSGNSGRAASAGSTAGGPCRVLGGRAARGGAWSERLHGRCSHVAPASRRRRAASWRRPGSTRPAVKLLACERIEHQVNLQQEVNKEFGIPFIIVV